MFKETRSKRQHLVNSLRNKGIKNEGVINAIFELPRELFLPQMFRNNAYEDTALPIECQQTISQPYTVAFMTELLDVQSGEKILEIGTGSGYQACILALLEAEVYTIERHEDLFKTSSEIFKKLDLKVNQKLGDGSLGWIENSPFDKIIVTASSPKVPTELIKQLKIDGRMIIPIGSKETQKMVEIIKVNQNEYLEKDHGFFKFVPLIGDQGWKK